MYYEIYILALLICLINSRGVMVWNIFLEPFLLISCFIGNSVSEGVMTQTFRFKTFSVAFLEASSLKTDVSDLLGKLIQDLIY